MIELCKIVMRNTFITLEYYFTINCIYRITNVIFYEFDAFFEFGSASHRWLVRRHWKFKCRSSVIGAAC